MKENLKRIHILVSGRVQGVFFRSETKKKAQKLGLTGWVRNLPDERVEILAEGEEEKLKELIDWAKRGPEFARVDDLKIEWQECQNEFKDFEIRYD